MGKPMLNVQAVKHETCLPSLALAQSQGLGSWELHLLPEDAAGWDFRTHFPKGKTCPCDYVTFQYILPTVSTTQAGLGDHGGVVDF